MAYPGIYNLTGTKAILQNATRRIQFRVQDENGVAIDITNWVVDADIKNQRDEQLATFDCTITNAVDGRFEIEMPPATTVGIAPGNYFWDLSMTQPNGRRYYWLKGVVTVEKTQSRND